MADRLIQAFLGEHSVLVVLQELLVVLLHSDAIVGQHDIVAGGHSKAQDLLVAVLLQNGHHTQRIGPHKAVKATLPDQVNDLLGEDCGVFGIDMGIHAVADHDGGQQAALHQVEVGHQLLVEQVLLGVVGAVVGHVGIKAMQAAGIVLATGQEAVIGKDLGDFRRGLGHKLRLVGQVAIAALDVQIGTPGTVVAGRLGVGHHRTGEGAVILGLIAGRQRHQRDGGQLGTGQAHLHVGDDQDRVVGRFLYLGHELLVTNTDLHTAQSVVADQFQRKLSVLLTLFPAAKSTSAKEHADLLFQ